MKCSPQSGTHFTHSNHQHSSALHIISTCSQRCAITIILYPKKLHNHHSYLTPPFLVLHAIDDDLSCNQKRPVYYYCIKMSTAILTTNGLKDRGIANILLYINKLNTWGTFELVYWYKGPKNEHPRIPPIKK